MKKLVRIWVAMMLIFLTIFTSGCSKNSEVASVEAVISENASRVAEFFQGEKVNLNISRESNKFIVYPEAMEDSEFTMLIPCNFEEKTEFEIPRISDEVEFPKEQQKLLEEAVEVAKKFVVETELISVEDKEKCLEALETVTVHYANFCDPDFVNAAIITNGNTMWVNKNMAQYLTSYFYLHECIHVISNITNAGSAFEYSYYRASKANEAVTDIITIILAEEAGFKGMSMSAYQIYYDYVYVVTNKVDMLNAYFYSDGYHEIIDEVGKDVWDLYILAVDYCVGTEQCWFANQIVYDFFK